MKLMLKKYFPFLRVNLMTMLAYRASIISWFFVEIFYFIMMIFLWQSIYKDKTVINGFNIDQIIFYFLIIGMIGILVRAEPLFTVSQELRQGQISMYLIKPINYKTRILFEEIGRRIGISLLMIPVNLVVILACYFIFKLNITINPINIIIFIIFIPLNFILMYEFSYMFGLLSIYTTNIFGLAILSNIILSISSGFIIPLDFYPSYIRQFIDVLPFQFVNYYPSMILLGKIDYKQIIFGMVLLIVWIIFFKIINYILFKFNEKKIVIFGG